MRRKEILEAAAFIKAEIDTLKEYDNNYVNVETLEMLRQSGVVEAVILTSVNNAEMHFAVEAIDETTIDVVLKMDDWF